jgi:succinate dehydrogenase/fumarate reductase cytochrome b subunit
MMKKLVISASLFLFPLVSFAQIVTDVNSLLDLLNGIINAVIPFLIAIAVLFFVYGLVKFILNAGDEGAQKEARSFMIWSVVALFVIVSVWGLVNILVNTFGLETTPADVPDTPTIPGV